jgi:acyl-CoA thioester hydrolase
MKGPAMTTIAGIIVPTAVHFDDLDPVGVVHNARYAIFVERAIGEFWAAQGIGFRDGGPSTPDMFAVVAEFSIRFLAPIRSTGPVDVHLWLDSMGSTSAVWGFAFLSADHSTVFATGKRAMVKIDRSTNRPSPWSEEARAICAPLIRG